MPQAHTARKFAFKWQHSICSALFIAAHLAYGQPAIPKFESFQPINLKAGYSLPLQPTLVTPVNPMLPNDPYRDQNYRMMQQAGMTVPGPNNRQRSLDEVRATLNEERKLGPGNNNLTLNLFQNNLRQFLQLNPDSFSITKAVYLSESAFYDNSVLPPYEEFEKAVKKRAELVSQILKREGLSKNDNLSVNYAIQKLFSQDNEYYDSVTGNVYMVKRLSYDFDDYMGDKDWTKMYVSKLLHTGSGQCHSLPLLYLCIAEQLHAKAYLSLAPNHSFIQYFDRKGNKFNFETTNANLVSETWLAQNTFVTSAAIKNKTYLDTLSARMLFAQCLGDFLLSYFAKMRHYDEFSNGITKKIQNIYPSNITALMEQANLANIIFQKELVSAGNPPEGEYAHFPKLYEAYFNYSLCQQQIERTGFQRMPTEAYQSWLKSLDYEKQKQENQAEQERMNREIRRLKLMRSTLKHDIKN